MHAPRNLAKEARENRKLLRRFDRIARRARPRLVQLGGDAFAEGILLDARADYEKLLPELPDIGGSKNQFSKVIEINGWIVSLYRAMKAGEGQRKRLSNSAVRSQTISSSLCHPSFAVS
jgi:hypothetical protein